MKRTVRTLGVCALAFLLALAARAADTAAAPAKMAVSREATDLLERFVTWLHSLWFFPAVDNRVFHWIACLIVVVLAIVLRHLITNGIFYALKKFAATTETTLDDKLFPAIESPVATLVMVLGIFAALTVLQFSPAGDRLLTAGAKIAVLAVLTWGAIRAGGAILDHAQQVAAGRQMTVATFMPLIKKTLLVCAVIVGLLFMAESLGLKVGVFLTSLGIGGLAVALAAQDTIANLFGSFVVVIDQPFKVGDFVKIGDKVGAVEDIGLRSTKLRLVDKSLLVMPNKTVSAEAIVNLARFTGRRFEQVFGLTYDAKPEQVEALVEEIRGLIRAERDVDPSSIIAYFRDYGASSLEIWIVYLVNSPDFILAMNLKQRLNLAIMRAVYARGLSFALPTQTVRLRGDVEAKLAERK